MRKQVITVAACAAILFASATVVFAFPAQFGMPGRAASEPAVILARNTGSNTGNKTQDDPPPKQARPAQPQQQYVPPGQRHDAPNQPREGGRRSQGDNGSQTGQPANKRPTFSAPFQGSGERTTTTTNVGAPPPPTSGRLQITPQNDPPKTATGTSPKNSENPLASPPPSVNARQGSPTTPPGNATAPVTSPAVATVIKPSASAGAPASNPAGSATFSKPDQNLSFKIPVEGQVFRAVGDDMRSTLYVMKSGQLQSIGGQRNVANTDLRGPNGEIIKAGQEVPTDRLYEAGYRPASSSFTGTWTSTAHAGALYDRQNGAGAYDKLPTYNVADVNTAVQKIGQQGGSYPTAGQTFTVREDPAIRGYTNPNAALQIPSTPPSAPSSSSLSGASYLPQPSYTFSPTAFGTVEVFQNGNRIGTTTPQNAAQNFGYTGAAAPTASPGPAVPIYPYGMAPTPAPVASLQSSPTIPPNVQQGAETLRQQLIASGGTQVDINSTMRAYYLGMGVNPPAPTARATQSAATIPANVQQGAESLRQQLVASGVPQADINSTVQAYLQGMGAASPSVPERNTTIPNPQPLAVARFSGAPVAGPNSTTTPSFAYPALTPAFPPSGSSGIALTTPMLPNSIPSNPTPNALFGKPAPVSMPLSPYKPSPAYLQQMEKKVSLAAPKSGEAALPGGGYSLEQYKAGVSPDGRGYCTDYARKIYQEVTGASLPIRGDAGTWYSKAQAQGLQTLPASAIDRVPPGAIAVWQGADSKAAAGHVAVVTQNAAGQITFSEANWAPFNKNYPTSLAITEKFNVVSEPKLTYDAAATRGIGGVYKLAGFILP